MSSQLSAMFTCRDGKGGKLSSQASKMLYKPPGEVYVASYKEPLDQSDYWKLFVQLWNYTKYTYTQRRFSGISGESGSSHGYDFGIKTMLDS